MKKVILILCLVFGMISLGFSQQRGGDRMAEMKKNLKEQLSLTDAQIDTIMVIENEFRPRMREIRMDQAMSDEDKATKSKAINEEKKVKLEAALGKETAAKVDAYYTEQRSKMRGNGDRPKGDKAPADK